MRLAFFDTENSNRVNEVDTLVVVFLRGAADALNMVIPHGEAAYHKLRPRLSIARPDDMRAPAARRAIDLDGFFGLHPALQSLLPAWEARHLGVVHACGAPDISRSHFRAMELIERGVSDDSGPASGWIGRHLASLNTDNPSPLRAIGVGEMTQRSLYGTVPVTALRDIADFHLGGDLTSVTRMQSVLAALYAGSDPLSAIGQEMLDILETLEKLDIKKYRPSKGVQYPISEFGMGMQQIAMLIKADVGLEVAAIDLGGWDTHFAQGTHEGLMPGLMADLGQGLAALYKDLFDHIGNLNVLVMSEFGRRAGENASLGTDHGHGSLMLLLGGHVRGRQVYSEWPGLESGQLIGPGDLAVTIDYRDVLAEVITRRLNNPALAEIFPDCSPTLRGFLLD